jgi:hypothetical protein
VSRKIAFLIPYFGRKFPDYFHYFLKSASHNNNFLFIIFTNILIPKTLPNIPNIKFVRFNLKDFNQLASKKLKLEIDVSEPYKLCDFKPAYGLIFEDFILDFDFWGYCDLDIILGNIEKFIDSEKLRKYEIISVREEYLSGFFAIYKNSDKIKYIFKKSKDWEFVLTNEDNFCFDECNWEFYKCLKGISILEIDTEIESMTHVVLKERMFLDSSFNNCSHEFLGYAEFFDLLRVNSNGLYSLNSGKEYILTHLIRLKKFSLFDSPKFNWKNEEIYIDRFGLSNLSEHIEERKLSFMRKKVKFNQEDFFIEKVSNSFYLRSFTSDMVISLRHIYQLLVLFHDNHPITANDLHDSFQDNNDVNKAFLKEQFATIVYWGLSNDYLKLAI